MDTLAERSLTADEAMDMERFMMTLTIDMVAQSGDGSLIWRLLLLSGQHHSLEEAEEEAEAAESFGRAASDDNDGQEHDDDDDDMAYQSDSDPESGYPTEETLQATVLIINDMAQRLDVDLDTIVHRLVYGDEAYGDDGGVVLVPASGAAVAGLEKQVFHATAEGCDDSECGCGGVTGCAICLEDFEDGEEVTVVPCSGGHEFHPGCITEWLGQSNTCPLCRHALPTDVDDGP